MHDVSCVSLHPVVPDTTQTPMSMEESFEFQPQMHLNRKCDYRKSMPPGSTLERNQRAQYQRGVSNGNGRLTVAAEVVQVSLRLCAHPCIT